MNYNEKWRHFINESLQREAGGRSFADQSAEIQSELGALYQDFEEDMKEASTMVVADYLPLALEKLKSHIGREFSTKAGNKSWVFQGIHGYSLSATGFVILGRLMYKDRSFQERTLYVSMGTTGWLPFSVGIENGRPEDHHIHHPGWEFTDLGG
ncbi:MAG TPA: hypothetical protein VMW36_06450 [Patescibacteria group bacterium]|nr:hypothetical protein [Patescibacteria group bacterium]